MPQHEPKPSVTVLYDAQEESVRKEEMAEGKKVPQLVKQQIEAVLTKRAAGFADVEDEVRGIVLAEFAMAARRAKPEMSHGDVIERIVQRAMAHPIRERVAI